MQMVTTPWLPFGIPKRDLSLSQEAAHFSRLVLLTPQEQAERAALCEDICRDAIQWVEVGLAGAAGCELEVLALVAPGSEDMLGMHLQRLGTVKSVEGMPFTWHLTARCQGVAVQATSDRASFAKVLRGVEATKTVSQHMPGLAAARAVVGRLLLQGGNLGGPTGLSEAALLSMLLATGRRVGIGADAGSLILEFTRWFGEEFDFAADVCDPNDPSGKRPREASDSQMQFEVLDAAGCNVAARCARLAGVKASLRSSSFMLARWEGPRRRGCYKGRTPLSGIVTYRDLWERSRQVLRPPSPPHSNSSPSGDALSDELFSDDHSEPPALLEGEDM